MERAMIPVLTIHDIKIILLPRFEAITWLHLNSLLWNKTSFWVLMGNVRLTKLKVFISYILQDSMDIFKSKTFKIIKWQMPHSKQQGTLGVKNGLRRGNIDLKGHPTQKVGPLSRAPTSHGRHDLTSYFSEAFISYSAFRSLNLFHILLDLF